MKGNQLYDKELLVYNQIIPKVSLKDNKNKIIIRGNKGKNSVSLIFREDNELIKYMKDDGYKFDVLVTKDISMEYENINNANNESNYKRIENSLNKYKINKNLCYVVSNISSLCKDKYLFKHSLEVGHSNISSINKKIESGEIILINNSISLSELQFIIKQIEYSGLKIVYLSELISEIN